MGKIGNALAALAPQYALKRAIARHNLNELRSYDGASKTHRTAGWVGAGSGDGESESRVALPVLRQRSRDLCRNNGFGVHAQMVIMNMVVGTGVMPLMKSRSKRRAEKARVVFERLLEETTELDILGEETLIGLQHQIAAAVMESGEVFVRRIWLKNGERVDGRMPFQLQVLEPDWLCEYKDTVTKQADGTEIRGGIEYDTVGRKVAYHFYKTHPTSSISTTLDTVRVMASEVLHVMDNRRRPGLSRNVPWMSPVIVKMRDHQEFADAVLLRQKIGNCFAAFIEKGPTQANPSLSQSNAGHEVDVLEPALIQTLNPGENIKFSNPPGAVDYDKYDPVVMREIAAGIGITYEALTGDLTKVNYSSGRMGRIQMDANVRRWQRQMMVSRFLRPLTDWVLSAMELSEDLPGGRQDLRVKWNAPVMPIVDPGKEIRPLRDEVRAGLRSPQSAIIELGRNPESVLDEIEEWNAQLDKRGIMLDSDPRYLSGNGVANGLDGDETDDEPDDD